MKVPTASVINGPASDSPSRNRISMASMLRTKLSLKTEKNWHQNKPAKRRARNKEASMANGGIEVAGSSLMCATARRGLRF